MAIMLPVHYVGKEWSEDILEGCYLQDISRICVSYILYSQVSILISTLMFYTYPVCVVLQREE